MNSPKKDFQELLKFLMVYQSKKTALLGRGIEKGKGLIVEILMLKRGKLQKRVWHSSMIGLAAVGVLTSGILGGESVVASTLSGIGADDPRAIQTFDPNASGGASLNSLVDLKTLVSVKPRDQIIDYTVKGGDTLSTIAQAEGVSVDTIRWENNLTSDTVKPGDDLKILPVSGVAVTVKSGDTLQSIGKKYSADAQAILDFPFNDIPDDLSLKVGQVLIVPDGSPPNVPVPPKPSLPTPEYLANGIQNSPSFSAPNGASFIWPTHSVGISQYFSWYHPGLDLPNPAEPPVVAAYGGTVSYAGWDNTGYGNRIDISSSNGYLTRYAHLSNIYVSIGQGVSQGETIGQMGDTGRSTGPHLHFEIHFNGIAINPLAILH